MFAFDPRCEPAILAAPATRDTAHEELGCGLQGPSSRLVRKALVPLKQRIRRLGEARALEQAGALVDWLEQTPAWDALCTSKTVQGRRQLKSAVLFPRESLSPRVLQLRHATDGQDYRAIDASVDASRIEARHDLVRLLQAGA